jgi:hypothetical protein
VSLKLFHVVFVVAALILALWTGVWALGEGGATWLAVCCLRRRRLAGALVALGMSVFR